MRILVVNPNTNRSMTDAIAATARRYASAGTEIVALTARHGADGSTATSRACCRRSR